MMRQVVYVCSDDGQELGHGEFVVGPPKDGAPMAEIKAQVYTFDVHGVSKPRGWMFFDNRLDYELTRDRPRPNVRAHGRTDWFSLHLPYTFIPLEGMGVKHLWLPLNREYKPLGITRQHWVDYEAYAHIALRFHRDPRTFPGIWLAKALERGDLYLYNDNPHSCDDYFERLKRLFDHKVSISGDLDYGY